MTIGQRVLAARQEAGLSQRQLAGENITRNMLSAIEHDKARPSLETLGYLSQVLHKPVSWFLGEDQPAVEGFGALVQARDAYDSGRFRACLDHLETVPAGEVLSREVGLLRVLAILSLAEEALTERRMPYARELLARAEEAAKSCPYFTRELDRRLAILRAKAAEGPQERIRAAALIPEDDGLLLQADCALEEERFADARRYLEAVDDRDARWNYLMGETLFGLGEFRAAAECYHIAEGAYGTAAVCRRLQLCYAGLKDFEKAYYYATMA